MIISLLALVGGFGTLAPTAHASPRISIVDVTHNEGTNTGWTNYRFTMEGQTDGGEADVNVEVNDGTATAADNDYYDLSFNFRALGEWNSELNVQVWGDTKAEPDETFTVVATITQKQEGGGFTSATGLGTILNDDAPAATVVVDDVSAAEGNSGQSNLSFPVSIPCNTNPCPSTFRAQTTDGTATTSDSDYVAANSSVDFVISNSGFNPGETASLSWDVQMNGDTKVEPNEALTLTLTLNTGESDSGVGTIVNDDAAPRPATISIGNPSGNEGDSGQHDLSFFVEITCEASPCPTSADITTVDGTATTADSDYVHNSGTNILNLSPGQKWDAGITGTVLGDTKVEADEVFTLRVTLNTGETATGTATIFNDDVAPPPPTERTCADPGADAIVGTNNSETLQGTPGDDVIVGLGGADTLRGLGGKDLLCGGDGRDNLLGGSNDDKIYGGNGDDTLNGEGGIDLCNGEAGAKDRAVKCETVAGVP